MQVEIMNEQMAMFNATIDNLNNTIKDRDREIEKFAGIRTDFKKQIQDEQNSLQNVDEEVYALKKKMVGLES